MLKATVIIGNESKNRSLKAAQVAFSKNLNTTYIQHKNKKVCEHYFFNTCEANTQMVVIDAVHSSNDLEKIIWMIQSEVVVEKHSRRPFCIKLKEVVIVCNDNVTREQIEDKGASLSRRIELIEL
jgi:hypothetical protein